VSGVANQHIEVDGSILDRQVEVAREASAAFSAASASTAGSLDGAAFGVLSQGILVPAVNALAGRSRELLATAKDLSDRMAEGVSNAAAQFAAVEQDAVDAFTKGEQ
jgi:hypothetical protein